EQVAFRAERRALSTKLASLLASRSFAEKAGGQVVRSSAERQASRSRQRFDNPRRRDLGSLHPSIQGRNSRWAKEQRGFVRCLRARRWCSRRSYTTPCRPRSLRSSASTRCT